jgi:hypothetical protein
MDTIGLLAAWIGVICLLFTIPVSLVAHALAPRIPQWWAKTSPARAERRIAILQDELGLTEGPDGAYVADLISLYGAATLSLIAAVGTVIVSLLILDLGPALLASILPFNIDSKILTRFTGLFVLAISYFFVFRLSYLTARIRLKTLIRNPEYAKRAVTEIAELQKRVGTQLATTLSTANRLLICKKSAAEQVQP